MTSRIMKDLLQLSLKEEIGGLTNLDMDGLIYDFLSNEEVEELAGKINLLPAEYRNILFFRFCFKIARLLKYKCQIIKTFNEQRI